MKYKLCDSSGYSEEVDVDDLDDAIDMLEDLIKMKKTEFDISDGIWLIFDEGGKEVYRVKCSKCGYFHHSA